MSEELINRSELVVEHIPDTPPVVALGPANRAYVAPPEVPPTTHSAPTPTSTPAPASAHYAGPMLPPKSAGVAYLLLLFTFVGFAGIQHFYLGKTGRGLLWIFTWGIFGIGTLIDIFTLPAQTRQINAQRAVGIN